MKKFAEFLKKNIFVICLVVLFILGDMALEQFFAPYIISSGRYILNDFEITQRDHPEEVWDKVFFGNSTVISGYREDESDSGYINLGLDDGVVTDLRDLIKKGEINIGSELVIGLNWLTMYDEFETNPYYIWHRTALEPYCYFQRDRLFQTLKNTDKDILGRDVETPGIAQTKSYYTSSVADAALADKVKQYDEEFWHVEIDKFDNNMQALSEIIDYCSQNNIRLRVLWMPWNPKVAYPELCTEVKNEVNNLCAERGIEVKDMTTALPAECFYDLGHLNHEYGSHVFTKEVSPWLSSKTN